MFFLLLLIILTALISAATIFLVEEPGYIFLQWGQWQVELSLVFAILVILIIVLLLYLVLAILGGVIRIPLRIGRSYQSYREQRTHMVSAKGYVHLLQGEWSKAEKLLEGSAKRLPQPIANHLAAAYAAQKRGDMEKRDLYLANAKRVSPEYQSVVSLMSCRLQIEQGQITDAIESLKKLCYLMPNNAVALRTLAEAYKKQDSWSEIYHLLPHLQRSKALSTSEYSEISFQATAHQLKVSPSASEVFKTWKKLPAQHQHNPEVVAVYVRKLLEFNRHQEAEKILRRKLNIQWNSDLAYLYGLIRGEMDNKRLYSTVLKWVKDNPNDPELLLTAGKLASRNQLWGKAQGFLETSIERGGRSEAYEVLGNLLENQGHADEAFSVYKDAATKPGRV